jgi:hypothetical protein
VVVLFLTLFVGPEIGAHASLDKQLIAFARMSGNRLAESTEGHKPDGRDHLARSALLVLPGVVGTDQTKPGVGSVALGHELRITGEMPDGGQRETVHKRSSTTLSFVLIRG